LVAIRGGIVCAPFSREYEVFALVIYEQVLEHISDPDKEIELISNAQPEGGLLYIGVPGILNFPEHYAHNFVTYLQYAHLWHFQLDTLTRLLGRHGYALVSGDETIRAVFRKVSAHSVEIAAPPNPSMLLNLIAAEEYRFDRSWHFLRRIRGYLAFIFLLGVSYIHPRGET
jgi:hypothetical protein